MKYIMTKSIFLYDALTQETEVCKKENQKHFDLDQQVFFFEYFFLYIILIYALEYRSLYGVIDLL